MKIRSLLLSLLLCFGWLSTAASLHAETDAAKKKKKKTTQTSPASHRRTHSASTAKVSPKTKAPVRKRTLPATTTAEDEEDTHPSENFAFDTNRPPQVYARSVLLINARTGDVLYEKDADAPRQIASTTKLMTALLIAEAGNLNAEVEVQPIDTICEPTKLYFKPGERYSRGNLLYALLVHSCNDVARALARDNAGSIDAFANRMNARAAQLGARDTHFVNPNGLPSPGEDQHSTARDLARIARAVYFNQTLRPIMATQHLDFPMANGQIHTYSNTNKVLGRFPYCNGMKTGYTDAAGHCLVSSADDSSNAVISVCLGDTKAIWNDSQKMLAYGLAAARTKGTAQNGGQVVPGSANIRPAEGKIVPITNDTIAPPWETRSKMN